MTSRTPGCAARPWALLFDTFGVRRCGALFVAAVDELSGILERLGSSAESWRARLEKLKSGRLLGRFFAASRERLARSRHS